MARLRIRALTSTTARCLRCGELATLTVHETRYVRGWANLLDPSFDAAAARTATCSGCATTYPVRRTDRSAASAQTRRRDAVDVPSARDWRRTAVQV